VAPGRTCTAMRYRPTGRRCAPALPGDASTTRPSLPARPAGGLCVPCRPPLPGRDHHGAASALAALRCRPAGRGRRPCRHSRDGGDGVADLRAAGTSALAPPRRWAGSRSAARAARRAGPAGRGVAGTGAGPLRVAPERAATPVAPASRPTTARGRRRRRHRPATRRDPSAARLIPPAAASDGACARAPGGATRRAVAPELRGRTWRWSLRRARALGAAEARRRTAARGRRPCRQRAPGRRMGVGVAGRRRGAMGADRACRPTARAAARRAQRQSTSTGTRTVLAFDRCRAARVA
jgi:hypothetical protein